MNLICSQCKKEKPEMEFSKSATAKNGHKGWCKMCSNKGHKAWYRANRKKCLIDRKAYYQANKEKVAALQKAYELANKKKVAARKRAYCLANKEKIAAYYAKNREKRNVNNRKYKSLKAGNNHESYKDIDVFERDGWICQLCGRKINRRLKWPHPYSKSIDHIIPLSKGGADALINVQSAHLRCNISKNAGTGGQLRLIG